MCIRDRLWIGAHIRRLDGSVGRVRGHGLEAEGQVMYNLTVAGAHTFFVGEQRWLVHNSGPCDQTVFYRIIGDDELNKLDRDGWQGLTLKRNPITRQPKGEKFVSPEEWYVRFLGERDSTKYKHVLRIQVLPGTVAALDDLLSTHKSGLPPVQYKMERGVMNIGLRVGGIDVFNSRIVSMELLK